jgi:hypothetical protein
MMSDETEQLRDGSIVCIKSEGRHVEKIAHQGEV